MKHKRKYCPVHPDDIKYYTVHMDDIINLVIICEYFGRGFWTVSQILNKINLIDKKKHEFYISAVWQRLERGRVKLPEKRRLLEEQK